VRVQVFGDAAIVTGRFDVTGRAMGQIVDGVDDYLTMYVKREGRWQQVATHALRVPGSTRSQGAAVAEGNRRPINA
jgi:ketosteroid isomerase-like protein